MATGYHRRTDFDALTSRQRDVLALIARGRTNGEIATELGIGFESVKSHVSEILTRLQVTTREEAAAAWKSRGRRVPFPGWLAALVTWKMAAASVAALVVVGTVAGMVASRGNGDDEPASQVAETFVEPVPAGMQAGPQSEMAFGEGDIHEARLDLATRLGVSASSVRLYTMEFRAWDGCGPAIMQRIPGVPPDFCLSTWFPGDVVTFESGGLLYRYTVQSNPQYFIAVEWSGDVVIREGEPGYLQRGCDPNDDLSRTLAYANGDVEAQTGLVGDWTVTFFQRVNFSDGCLGFERIPKRACAAGTVPGAIVEYSRGSERHRYHVAYGRVIAVDIEPGKVTVDPDASLRPRLLAMRQHLATRLSVPVELAGVVDYRDVVWGDSCLAIYYTGLTCREVESDGYFAAFRAAGHEWHYHGTADRFEPAAPPADENTRFGTWKRLR